jgi:hypothetical protein
LIKWKDKLGHLHRFRLVNRVAGRTNNFCHILHQQYLDYYRKILEFHWLKIMQKWLDDGGTDGYPATWKGLFLALKDTGCEAAREELEVVLKSEIIRPSVQYAS